MIQSFVNKVQESKNAILEALNDKTAFAYGPGYSDLVDQVVLAIGKPLDPGRVTQIDHGDYQGTQCYVVAETGYQPWRHWAVLVSYGSCSGCDSLQSACDEHGEERDQQIWQLVMNIVQSMKAIHSEAYE